MNGAAAWDLALFRWINRDLAHPWMDGVMRSLSHNPLLVPALVVLGVAIAWKGGLKGRVFLVMIGIGVGLANELVVETLKDWVARPRPYVAVSDAVLRLGRGNPNASMPSGHALLTAAATVIAGWYYPRVLWGLVPLVLGIAVSRVYNGVHYPSDVLAGILLGAAFAWVYLQAADRLWRWGMPRCCPRCASRLASLLRPGGPESGPGPAPTASGPTS